MNNTTENVLVLKLATAFNHQLVGIRKKKIKNKIPFVATLLNVLTLFFITDFYSSFYFSYQCQRCIVEYCERDADVSVTVFAL